MQTKIKTNYQSFMERIKAAKTGDELEALEDRTMNHYNLGTLTVSEYQRLDLAIFEKHARLGVSLPK